jgi:hypothetical protein
MNQAELNRPLHELAYYWHLEHKLHSQPPTANHTAALNSTQGGARQPAPG